MEKENPEKQARLDDFIASRNMIDVIRKCDISLNYRSDHSIQQMEIMLNNFNRGNGV